MNKIPLLTNWLFFLLLIMSGTFSNGADPHCSFIDNDENQYRYSINFNLEPADAIVADTIVISTDSPQIKITSWQLLEPTELYLPEFKETKKVLTGSSTILVTLTVEHIPEKAELDIRYYQRNSKAINEHRFTLLLPQKKQRSIQIEAKVIEQPATQTPASQAQPQKNSWAFFLTNWFSTTNSNLMRIFLAFMLGIALSLTPCIYPMIPITVGILQSQAQTSFVRNLTLASCYTLGIATTFSVLGLLAAFTGQLFGSIMNNPIVIFGIVLLLLYLAGSMIGLYDMYTPSFLQNRKPAQGGSALSAFLFGAVSGTIASPCLSPGLLLLLSIVTQLKSLFLGFLLLFSFGIGLSTPLLIIGTFSSSLNVLPRAGTWMIDIKQLIGFMMIGICFYFLNNVLPFNVTVILFSLFILGTGLFYLYQASKRSGGILGTIKKSSGTLLVAASVLLFAKGYQLSTFSTAMTEPSFWLSDYGSCIAQAKKEHKKILLDISAPYCSICKAIDHKFFTNPSIIETLSTQIVPIKIADLDSDDPIHKEIKQKYNVVGVPTLLLIDPTSGEQLCCWGSELYDYQTGQFIDELQGKAGVS